MTEHPQISGLTAWKPVARGGLATVWEAQEMSGDRRVAVKVYQRELHGAGQRHFAREAHAAARLAAHPGILTPYSAGILPDGRPYLVMEFCPGGSLTRWLKPEHRPTPEQVRRVGRQVADSLAAAHAVGVLHRDVKPANILIDSEGNPRLADFGLATERGAETDPGDALWLTPAWAAPEVLRLEPATEAGDVYSLAATLYALLAGCPPHDVGCETNPLEQMAEIARQPIPPITGVSQALMQVLLAALHPDPAARPSAEGFLNQLAKVPLRTARSLTVAEDAPTVPAAIPLDSPPMARLEGQTDVSGPAAAAAAPVAPQLQPAESPPRLRSRRRSLAALAAAAAVVIASATAWLVIEPAAPGSSALSPQTSRRPAVSASPTTPESSSPAGASTPGNEATGRSSTGGRSIQLAKPVGSAKPFQPAQIRGTYPGGAETLLHVQRWEEGAWLTFPVPTMTNASGEFTAHVELGRPGRYRLRVVDPDSGARSEPLLLVVEG